MKKILTTKKGLEFEVELSTEIPNKTQRQIALFSNNERIATIVEDGAFHSEVKEIVKNMKFHEVLAIAEVVENFDQYFRMLNQ